MGVAGERFAAVRLVDGPVLVVDPEDVGGEELRVFFDEPDRAFGRFLPGAGDGGVEEGGFGGQEAPVDAEGGAGCADEDGDYFAGEAPGRFVSGWFYVFGELVGGTYRNEPEIPSFGWRVVFDDDDMVVLEISSMCLKVL